VFFDRCQLCFANVTSFLELKNVAFVVDFLKYASQCCENFKDYLMSFSTEHSICFRIFNVYTLGILLL
jgi:hypothetical protein